MPRSVIPIYRFFLFSLLLLSGVNTYAQSNPIYNRFQYHEYKWQAFHTTAFHIYFPKGYDSLCAAISKEILPATALVKSRMNVPLQQTPNIILYPSTDQLYESNVGGFEYKDVTLPTFLLKGSRFLLHYNGNYEDLKQQLITGMIRAAWEEQLNEGLEAQVKGKEAIPYWMKEGMIRYFATQWPVQDEDELKQLFFAHSMISWEDAIANQPALAGAAFNYFLSKVYYPELPAQLYFQLKKRKPLPRALRLVTKTPVDSLYSQCLDFWKQRWELKTDTQEKYSIVFPHKGKILSVSANPQAEAIAYISAGWHKRAVYIYDAKTKRNHQLLSYQLPPWLNDHKADKYPLIQWTQQGNELLVALPVKGKLTIYKYDRFGSKNATYSLEGLDGLNQLTQTGNNEYLLAAFNKAQSDIVSYSAGKNRYQPLTNDRHDDKAPVAGHGKYFFVSKRPLTSEKEDTILQQGIFQVNGKEVKPIITDTIDYIQWTKPVLLDNGQLMTTTNINGETQYAVLPTTQQAAQHATINKLINANQPVQYLSQHNEVITWQSLHDSLWIRKQSFNSWQDQQEAAKGKPSPWLVDYRNTAAARAKEDSILKAATDTTPSFLDGVFGKEKAKAKSVKRADSLKEALHYEPKKSSPYVLQLYSAYFTAKINNDYFINRYQPYEAYQGQFRFPQISGMAQGGFSDLFENHHFNIAFRLPAGTEGSDFFIKYRNTTKQLNWGLAYYRKSEDLKPDPKRKWVNEDGRPYPNTAKAKTNYYELSLDYPLTYFSGVQATLAARQDKTIFPATEKYSLDFPAFKSLWSMVTLSYIINKLQPTLPLLYKGFSGQINIDAFKGFTQKESALAGTSIKAAYHLPLYKYITLVAQLQVGYSGGDHRILYNLGGVDNNITPRTDSNVHFAQAAPYAFQTLVTPLRGYLQNSVYGSSYALLNTDVYVPLFQSLIPVETPLSFINNLQPGLFVDVATAGGKAAYSTKEKGWQTAYGFSARTTLAGYPLRFDMGWPGSFNKKPVWYLSLTVK